MIVGTYLYGEINLIFKGSDQCDQKKIAECL